MKKNIGSADRVIRTVLAVIFGALLITEQVTGTWGIILGVVAGLLLLTSTVSFCPLYYPFKLSTAKSPDSK